jgi:hypothetical protein
VTDYKESYLVDAYGPMTLPGGGVHDALRIRYEERSPDLQVGYLFVAKDAALVIVTAADTTSPSSGVIPVASITWNNPNTVDVQSPELAPTTYALFQNYPNPFNPSTTITYQVPKAGLVSLEIFNILGQEVATLVNREQPPGSYQITWNATNLPSGAYLVKMQSGTFTRTMKIMLVR